MLQQGRSRGGWVASETGYEAGKIEEIAWLDNLDEKDNLGNLLRLAF